MANYCCIIRTNYFHVKDVSDFENLINSVWSEDSIDVFRDRDEQGREVVGFGTYGSIWGLTENDAEEGDDASYDKFIKELQKCVEDDDAILIMEVGHEKLRYLTGVTETITRNEYKAVGMIESAVSEASKMLKTSKYSTKVAY